jgi:hypothetical protein
MKKGGELRVPKNEASGDEVLEQRLAQAGTLPKTWRLNAQSDL